MADLPIHLSFFKKIEHYEFLTHRDKYLRDKGIDGDKAWSGEKEILRWTATGHRHLGTAIDAQYVENNILTNRSLYNNFPADAERSMENLVSRGWAARGPNGAGILFQKDGLLMGEVIDDVMSGCWRRWKYPFFYYLAWVTTLCGAFLIIAPVATAISLHLLQILHWLLLFVCRYKFK